MNGHVHGRGEGGGKKWLGGAKFVKNIPLLENPYLRQYKLIKQSDVEIGKSRDNP